MGIFHTDHFSIYSMFHKWIEEKSREDFLRLLKRVVSAPDELGGTDKELFEILNS